MSGEHMFANAAYYIVFTCPLDIDEIILLTLP